MQKIDTEFSFIIPCFNCSEYLEECISSIIKQNHKNIEIILINDSSTDQTLKICQKFSGKFDFIKTLNLTDNKGPSYCRNLGISKSIGKYIIFVDSDDYLKDNCLIEVSELIIKNNYPELIICNFTIEPTTGANYSFEDQYCSSLIENELIENITKYIINPKTYTKNIWSKIYKTSFLKKNNIFFIKDARSFEDQEFTTKVLCLCNSSIIFKKAFYVYRRRIGSLSKSISKKYALGGLKIITSLSNLYIQFKDDECKAVLIISSINNAINSLSINILALNSIQLIEMAKIQFKDISVLINIKSLLEENILIEICKKFHNYNCLAIYKDHIKYKIIQLVLEIQDKDIYIFCASKLGLSAANILKNEGIKFAGFIDNNEKMHGAYYDDEKIYSPDIFNSYNSFSLNSVGIIICNESNDNVKIIKSQLEKLGLKNNQIVNFKGIKEIKI